MTSDQILDTVGSVTGIETSVSDYWRQFQTEGIALIALGMAAAAMVPLTGFSAAAIVGWLFLISGAIGLLSAVQTHQAPGFGWSLLSAVLGVVAGGILLWNPWQGPAALTPVLIAFFNLDGVLIIMLALHLRQEATPRWRWIFASGVSDIVLAEIIIAAMPGTGTLGLFVGIDLAWAGISLVAIAQAVRDASELIRPVVSREFARQDPQLKHCFQG